MELLGEVNAVLRIDEDDLNVPQLTLELAVTDSWVQSVACDVWLH